MDTSAYDVTYSLSRWPAAGFEGDSAYIDVIKMRNFVEEFNDTRLLDRYFDETGDRLGAMKDFSRINVYVSDPEVYLLRLLRRRSVIVLTDTILSTQKTSKYSPRVQAIVATCVLVQAIVLVLYIVLFCIFLNRIKI